MKKLLAIALLTISLASNAFWNNGYMQDNGIFGFNPYEFWDPRWYAEEMSNMVDEFDDNNNWGNNYYGNNYGNGYNGYNGYNSYNSNPYRNYRNTPWNRR